MSTGTVQIPRIKIGGVRSAGEIAAVLGHGLDAIGLVDAADSPRYLDSASARALVRGLPPGVLPVIECSGASRGHAEAALFSTGARALQLDDDDDPREWRDFPFPLFKRIAVDEGAQRAIASWRGVAAGFVLDHPHSASWPVEVELARELARLAPCLLGGGLDVENVEQQIARIRPWGVEGNLRLEREPGRKDPTLVQRFVERAARALATLHGG